MVTCYLIDRAFRATGEIAFSSHFSEGPNRNRGVAWFDSWYVPHRQCKQN